MQAVWGQNFRFHCLVELWTIVDINQKKYVVGKSSAFEAEGCEFKSHCAQLFFLFSFIVDRRKPHCFTLVCGLSLPKIKIKKNNSCYDIHVIA